jgi:hypothetical protein
MMPNLTRDVLVHTWDLARAVGADDRLDPRWLELFRDASSSTASHRLLTSSSTHASRDAHSAGERLGRAGFGNFSSRGCSGAPGAVLDEPWCAGPMHRSDDGPDNSGGGMVSVEQLGG